jgi:hypothetical protein
MTFLASQAFFLNGDTISSPRSRQTAPLCEALMPVRAARAQLAFSLNRLLFEGASDLNSLPQYISHVVIIVDDITLNLV